MWTLKGWLALGVWSCALGAGCASDRDAGSRQVIAVTHLSTEPAGTVSVSDDRYYTFLTADATSETQGQLSQNEFDDLNLRLKKLATLYAYAASDYDVCVAADDSYILREKAEGTCFTIGAISDAESGQLLDYLIDFYKRKAAVR